METNRSCFKVSHGKLESNAGNEPVMYSIYNCTLGQRNLKDGHGYATGAAPRRMPLLFLEEYLDSTSQIAFIHLLIPIL